MRLGKLSDRLTKKRGKESFYLLYLYELWGLVTGLVSVVLSLFVMSLSYYVSKAKAPRPALASTAQTLAYFIGGIVLLAIVTIGTASFMRRKNRDVMLLKQRLAEIYSVALRKSALNPQLKSAISNE